ncbi:serine/threonine-protein kinase ATM-like [Hibiscus syriacus]|uniref:serine/threonine-protein kinase ATM-like n=1 Tax=Hibiscus syriacus TaxID=106335 RepID=UPI001923FFF1|nr:serine/threonine-protein kinase ATM-like [Hibiscus syriacus]
MSPAPTSLCSEPLPVRSLGPFSGLVICVTGLSKEARRQFVEATERLGGQYNTSLHPQCTHLVVQISFLSSYKTYGPIILQALSINAPKVVECLGSDGHKYKQLAKSGKDDLRQDAVMEQFFGLVNTFLHNHRDTWKRRLVIRTYKEKDKRKAFQAVCENFRPVMHYFFLERFLQPADWFEKRLAYTRSVAATSMVGYIVGLGDRHTMNILIDQATAEVVHIDLGVAFEQGLMLKTPERVPFRLTRDIIYGMGVTGVEGVFRKCCEETLCSYPRSSL